MESINAGDTAWVLIASAMVLLMVPALAFFYGGMVRKKNILSTLNLNFIIIGLVSATVMPTTIAASTPNHKLPVVKAT